MLARGAFSDKEVVKISKKFVPVLVDGDVERAIVKKYAIRGYPTVKFCLPDGKVLSEFVGAAKPKKVLVQARKALSKVKPRRSSSTP